MTAAGSTIPVMIVDGHPVVRQGLAELLRETQAHVVGQTGDSESAVRAVRQLEPTVVLVDADGSAPLAFDLISTVRSELPSARVIALADHGSAEGARQALRSGASGYIPKAIARDDLVGAIVEVACGGTVIDPAVLTSLVEILAGDQLGPTSRDLRLLGRLSSLEVRILAAATRGMTNSEIAAATCFTEGTIKNRLADIYRQIGVSNRAEAAYFATRTGIVK